jgi:hypothetical protein
LRRSRKGSNADVVIARVAERLALDDDDEDGPDAVGVREPRRPVAPDEGTAAAAATEQHRDVA